MSVPKKRRNSSSVGRNRAHLALGKVVLGKCPKCGKAIQAHMACSFCGVYKGREVIEVKSKSKKKK